MSSLTYSCARRPRLASGEDNAPEERPVIVVVPHACSLPRASSLSSTDSKNPGEMVSHLQVNDYVGVSNSAYRKRRTVLRHKGVVLGSLLLGILVVILILVSEDGKRGSRSATVRSAEVVEPARQSTTSSTSVSLFIGVHSEYHRFDQRKVHMYVVCITYMNNYTCHLHSYYI
jgi:hypothetical protein